MLGTSEISFGQISAWVLAAAAIAFAPGRVDAVTPAESVLKAQAERIAMIDRVSSAVVAVFDTQQRGGGSGVIIDEQGYGLTNYHVVAGMLDKRKGLGGLSDGKLYDLEVLGIDPVGDVAMFRLVGRETFPFADLGDSDLVRVGDTAIAMGNPFTLSDDYSPTVTLGIVTGIHRYQWGVKGNLTYTDCIQVDTSINPGNSGGPLFNGDGEVIGVNGRISVNTRGRYNVGFGYAITSNQMRRFIPALRSGLVAAHGTLQATVKLDQNRETVLAEMLPAGALSRSGAQLGDRLLSIDGVRITSPNHFASVLGTYPGSRNVRVLIERENTKTESIVRLDPIPPKMRKPYIVDQEVNDREVRRVLAAFKGSARSDDTAEPFESLKWNVHRTHFALADRDVKADQLFAARVTTEGLFLTEHSPEENETIRIFSFDGKRATQRREGEEEFDLTTDRAMVLAALDLVFKTLMKPPGDTLPGNVRHAGGDAVFFERMKDMAGDLDAKAGARYLPAREAEVITWPIGEDAQARLQFDMDSHDLLRIDLEDDPSGVRVSLDLHDYEASGVLRLPKTIIVSGPGYRYQDSLSQWRVDP